MRQPIKKCIANKGIENELFGTFNEHTSHNYVKSNTGKPVSIMIMIMPEKVPFGVIAPMTTPFAVDGELQAMSIRSQVEFLVCERADSLAVGGSTGEGQTMSPDELRACVSETRAAVCPRPMNAAELTRAADALDRLPRGRDLDFLAGQLERLNDGARICRGG